MDYEDHRPLAKSVPSFGALDVSAQPERPERDIDPRQLWSVLRRRGRLVLLIWAAFFLAVTAFSVLQPKHYTTQVALISGTNAGTTSSDTTTATTNLPILNALMAATGQQSGETFAELMRQSPVAAQVIQNLKLNTTVPGLMSHVVVKPVTDTAIITLLTTWSDPETSAKIGNEFAAVFVDRERSLVSNQAVSAITFLQKEMPAAQERMRSAQAALEAYKREVGIADLPTQTTNDINAVAALEAKMQAAQVEANQYSAQLDALNAQLAQTPQTINGPVANANNPVKAALAAQLAQAQLDLNTARKQYTDSFPTVIAARSRVAELQRQVNAQADQVVSSSETIPNPVYQALEQQATTVASEISSAQAQAEALSQQLSSMQPRVDRLPEQSRRITELERNEKTAEGLYNALQAKFSEAQISKTTALSDVTITQPADPNVFTVTPNVPFNIALGFVVGLILGITAAFGLEALDDRFRSADDVKERLRLPVLATIPMLGGDVPSNVKAALPDDPLRPLATEAFYQLVAALRYSSSSPPRVIAFTSADQGDGKSTIALNTAISLGLSNARVLLIDADLRRPTIHSKLGLSNDKGLSDVIVGVSDFDDAVRPTPYTGVSVLLGGRTAPNPAVLLGDANFDAVLKRARERYDYVIVDSPALRTIVDGVVVCFKADGVAMVISAANSDNRSVRSAIERLRSVGAGAGAGRGINLLGVVLNKAKVDKRDTQSYYLGAGQTIALAADGGA